MLDFLIIGASKSGTTSLYHYLRQHPDICMSEPKEPPFWFDDLEYEKGSTYYIRQYLAHCDEEVITGEANPNHLAGDATNRARRIHALTPEAKLVALLRDPIERAHSHWWQAYCVGDEDRGFEEAIESKSEYLRRGEYRRLLEAYLTVFRREQLLVVYSATLFSKPAMAVARVLKHVGADLTEDLTPYHAHNVSWNSPITATVSRILSQIGVVRLLPRPVRKIGRSLLSSIGSRPSPTERTTQHLERYYRKANQNLKELVGTVPPWR